MINKHSKVTAEHYFLLQCCCYHTKTTTLKNIQSLANESLNWSYLIHLATSFNLVPPLYKCLRACSSETIPSTILKELQDRSYAIACLNIALTKELLRLVQQLTVVNVAVIPFKGPLLAIAVYKDISLRQFVDLDLLVDTSDFARATDCLLAQGYKLGDRFEWAQNFVHSETGFNIDLHIKVSQDYFPFRFAFKTFWQSCQPVNLGNISIPCLAREDLLIILCIQVAKDIHHQQRCLNKVFDLAMIVTHQPLNWQTVMERAYDFNCERLIMLAVCVSHQLFKFELPEQLYSRLADDKIIKLYSQMAAIKLLDEVENFHRGLLSLMMRGLVLLDLNFSTDSHNWKVLRIILCSLGNKLRKTRTFLSIKRSTL